MNVYNEEKERFARALSNFSQTLKEHITSSDGSWTVKGFIDIFESVYTISADTKVVSKILELHLFPYFVKFADENGYDIELASHQNYYPDLTFVNKKIEI